MNIGLAIPDHDLAQKIVNAFSKSTRHRITPVPDPHALAQSANTPDVLLIDVNRFSDLRDNDPMSYLRLSRRCRIVVMLNSRELLDAARILAFADAWVFYDLNIDRIVELVDLGLEGHCLVPPQFLSRIGVDEIRFGLLSRLTKQELEILERLGKGMHNRTIAEELDTSEAIVKSLVRSVLMKLHFKNRTEAGVFAARQQTRLAHYHPAEDTRRAGRA